MSAVGGVGSAAIIAAPDSHDVGVKDRANVVALTAFDVPTKKVDWDGPGVKTKPEDTSNLIYDHKFRKLAGSKCQQIE